MPPEELVKLLTSLNAALAVAEAIVEPARQAATGWNLAGWSCEIVPGSVRFLHRGSGGQATAAVLAVQSAEGGQNGASALDSLPTTVVRFGRMHH